jgi:CubicO group peptidase (beta-lactamase class C family)
MDRFRRALLATFPLLVACSDVEAPPAGSAIATPPPTPAAAATSPTPTTEKLTADSTRTTAAGATFTAPAGWTLESNGSQRILLGPEPDLRVAIVDTTEATADAAVASAWRTLDPGPPRPQKLAQDQPARDGWEQQRKYTYETSPNERVVVYADALRKAAAWTVVLVHASAPASERFAANVRLIRGSLRPNGYTRESFAGKTARTLDAERIAELTGFVEAAREQAGIPGVAISLVQAGAVVFEGGFGVREQGKPAAVDADTLFMVASNTKALTTLLLATLVDEGKLAWDTPVASVYPTFLLGDAEVTRKLLIKHLVCACTGLPRRDLERIFEFEHATPRTRMELLATLQPTTGFGEVYQYSNQLAAAAGFIGGSVAFPGRELGAAYDEAMRARVFEPLGMTTTTFDFARAQRGNHARPHAEDIDGELAHVAMAVNHHVVSSRPSGGAWSSVRELTRYVQLELANGSLPGGQRLLAEEELLARRAPQVASGEDQTYGMGLTVSTRYGTPVVGHSGSTRGYKSQMFWLPEHGVGGVILTSSESGRLLLAPWVRRILEVLFDGRPEAVEDLAFDVAMRKENIAKERERLVVPPDPAALARLARRYTNAELGEIEVPSDGAAMFEFGEWHSAIASRSNDDGTTSFRTIDPGVQGYDFAVAERDGKRALVLRDMQHEYVFIETP